jgi:hypothetical protein
MDDVAKAMVKIGTKEITKKPPEISMLSSKSPGKEIAPSQGVLPLGIEKSGDFGEIGMGVLSNGTPYLSQRGVREITRRVGHVFPKDADNEPRYDR